MRPHRPLLAALLGAVVAIACSGDDDGGSGGNPQGADAPLFPPDGQLRASVRRTVGGVPHVRADDLASVAFGAGHAQAEDNVCLIAESVVKARGERAKFYGPGADNGNVVSDFSYRALGVAAGADAAAAALSAPSRALLEGFVAGYNRYVADTAPADLPPACREQPWVRAITPGDLLAHYRVVAGYASGNLFAGGALLAAVPPGASADPVVVSGAGDGAGDDPLGALDPASIGASVRRRAAARTDFTATGLASNAWGIGRTLSADGRGALLANPHFPYTGSRRLYQTHLTVPGWLGVNGAGLIGTALPLISFNRHLAWSHTVSTGTRFTLYELTLAAGDALAYVKDGETRPIGAETVRIEVANGTPTPTLLERTFYRSEYGPMLPAELLSGGALPAWGANGTAYTYRDANAGEAASGLLDTWLGLSRATDLESFRRVLRDCGNTFWTNTVYADDAGNAFYADTSSVPDLSDETLAVVAAKRAADAGYAALFDAGLVLLDGSTSRDDWARTGCDGRVPHGRQPALVREDFVQNSNSSHWASNPAAPLTGYSPLFGAEGTPLNARTRLGLRMLQDPTEPGFAASAPAGQDGRFDARELLEVIWNDRALYAEELLPVLRERCAAIGDAPVSLPGGGVRPVADACAVLAGWDGTYGVESVGAHVFRVFLGALFTRDDVTPAVPFDPADPVGTPAGVGGTGAGTADDPLLQSLAAGLDALDASGIAYDATLGSVQTYRPSGGVPPNGDPIALGAPIPWHGGDGELDGAFDAVGVNASAFDEDTRFPRLAPTLRPDTGGLSTAPGEGWLVDRGTSWHFGVAFGDDGPDAWGLTSYSQSSDPRSAWFTDQSEAYSSKTPRRLLFEEADIVAGTLPGGARELVGTLGAAR